jgi:hypothetical protein
MSFAVVACATADEPQIITGPDARGWQTGRASNACIAARSEELAIASRNGSDLILFVPGITATGPREIEFDGRSEVLVFEVETGGTVANLPLSLVTQMTMATTLKLRWPEREIDSATPSMETVAAVLACGSKLQQGREAVAERRDRMLAVAAILSRARGESRSGQAMSPRSMVNGGASITCFKKTEWTSNFNKNCVYDCLGSDAVQTIGSVELCPLSIQR